MKNILYFLIILLNINLNGQNNRRIIITKTPQTVPSGKKWVINANESVIVQVNELTLRGSKCNALFLSNPGILYMICEGDILEPNQLYGIIFKEISKVPYTNELTYSMIPITFYDKDFDIYTLKNKSLENIGQKNIEFVEGQTVFVSECIESIEATEYSISKLELSENIKKHKFIKYNINNSGLPDNKIISLDIDKDGNKWIGTFEHGLVKFDDKKWITYDKNNSELKSNLVAPVVIDNLGNKWLGTDNGNIIKFDNKNWYSYNLGSPYRYVWALAIDNKGNKWIGGTIVKGLAKFDDNEWIVYNKKNSKLTDNTITALAIDKNGTKWLGTFYGKVIQLDNNENWIIYDTLITGLPHNVIHKIAIDSKGNKWIGSKKGVFKFDNEKWISYNKTNSNIPDNNIITIEIDRKDNVWIGTENGGIAKLVENKWKVYNASNSDLPDNYIYAIKIDLKDNVWIGTNRGLAVFNEY